ncbi:MAG: RluA family pseudouridine synthase [Clostridia bacterium]|nr:RluA family pseudouridine synthase [Clostridia bacterium]
MRVENFKNSKRQKVSDSIIEKFPSITYSNVRKMLRQKDIKINGKRISEDLIINSDDEVLFYINEIREMKVDVVYEDENIVVAFKPRKIETVSEDGSLDFVSAVSNTCGSKCFAVHRLDRNTEGLVVFAKNEKTKQSLDAAFKNRTIHKFYLALVYGRLEKQSDNMVAYLKKYSDKSFVEISDNKKAGFEKIQTNYKLIKSHNDLSLVEIELVTGKTHQIRAHFAHIGHFLIGDEKYGDSAVNKIFKKKYQCLCAYKIIFSFDENDFLSYLDGKEISLDESKIDFCRNV